jgi:hypothetical protein
LVLFMQQRNAREKNGEQLQATLMVDFGAASSQPATAASQTSAPASERNPFPHGATIIHNRHSVMVQHDNVDLHYVFYYPGILGTATSGARGGTAGPWSDDGSITLHGNGRTFGYHRSSDDPMHLRVNGKEYDLGQGRVFVLHDDGTLDQRSFEVSLAVGRNPEALGTVIANHNWSPSAELSFGPAIEREVAVAIDFDSGELTNSIPESVTKPDDIAENVLKAFEWLEGEGMDALTEPSHSVKGVRLKAKAVDKDAWNQLTPEQVIATLEVTKREPWQNLDPNRETDEDLKTPATWIFETREGGKGILQVLEYLEQGVKIRFKLVKPASATTPPPPSPAALAEEPKLPFLAWQDVWKEREPGTAFHADGSPTTDAEEVRLQSHVQPIRCSTGGTDKDGRAPRFLHLWFSHPLFDQQSLNEVALFDNSGKPVEPRDGMLGSRACGPDDGDRLGWLTHTLNPGFGRDTPPAITIRLRYTLGPWKDERQVGPDESGVMAVGEGSQLNGVGQNAEGKAFLALAVNMEKDAAIQFGVVAVTKDGRNLQPSGRTSGGSNGGGVHVQRFTFDTSLANIAHFRLGMRPVRSVEFRNVRLPRN